MAIMGSNLWELWVAMVVAMVAVSGCGCELDRLRRKRCGFIGCSLVLASKKRETRRGIE